jgi:predicted RNA methylase
MLKSQINPANLQQHLDSATNAGAKGQAQYFTPPAWAKALALPLAAHRPVVVDLTCGTGNLLRGAAPAGEQLGCDLDAGAAARAGKFPDVVAADVCRFYPLLQAVNFQADCFVLNPPWDLHWHREPLVGLLTSDVPAVSLAFNTHDGRTARDTIDSTVATLCLALDRCSIFGEGYLIANESTLQRLILGPDAPHGALAAHCWAHLVIAGNICQVRRAEGGGRSEDGFQTGVLYFAREHTLGLCGPRLGWNLPPGMMALPGLEAATEACAELARQRVYLRTGAEVRSYQFSKNTAAHWRSAAEEWRRLTAPTAALRAREKFNLWLEEGRIQTHLSAYDQFARIDVQQAQLLHGLQGRRPIQLVIQRAERKAIEAACAADSPWRVAPELVAAIAAALAEYHRERAPLYPLPPVKRLGYLDEEDFITCRHTLRDLTLGSEFRAGERYPLRSLTVQVTRTGTRRNLNGLLDDVEYTGQELALFITDESGAERLFMESRLRDPGTVITSPEISQKEQATKSFPRPVGRGEGQGEGSSRSTSFPSLPSVNPPADPQSVEIDFTLEQLLASFVIPTVPDVAELDPAGYARHLAALDALEQLHAPFKFMAFQKQDLARLALTRGAILGWQQGLGKTIAMYALPALCTQSAIRNPQSAILLVAPGGLHQQIAEDGRLHFGAVTIALDSQGTFLKLSTLNPRTGRRELPPGYYLTSYTALSGNGVATLPEPKAERVAELLEFYQLTEADAVDFFTQREGPFGGAYKLLAVRPHHSLSEVRAEYFSRRKQYAHSDTMVAAMDAAFATLRQITPARRHGTYTDLNLDQRDFLKLHLLQWAHAEYTRGIGESRWYGLPSKESAICRNPQSAIPFKVRCVYSPSLADLCQDAFTVVMPDESTRMQGEDTQIGIGARQMNPEFRFPLTGTPIKNRLPQIFRLGWWATGGRPLAHGRFPYHDSAQDRDDLAGQFLVCERNLTREEATGRRHRKTTPQVCNVHLLWKLFSPFVLRRRKADCGVEIVPKHKHLVRVPMGTEQAAVYKFHLDASYRDHKNKPAQGAQLQALRIVACQPASLLLKRPAGDKTEGNPSSRSPFTPKIAAALRIIHQVLVRREQVVVFSAFLDALDILAARLTAARVPHLILDGRTSPSKRGKLAREFKLGPPRFSLAPSPQSALRTPHSAHPVLLAGEECMSEGYNFYLANNVIRIAFSWAFDKGVQAVERVHRINSPEPVNEYAILCDGSIDRRLESLNDEKGDACDLVLDGRLHSEAAHELSPADLLHIARQDFLKAATLDERALEADWPALCRALEQAATAWALPIAPPVASRPFPAGAGTTARDLARFPLFARAGVPVP